MASPNDSTISQDVDMDENDGEKVVTMMDVLQEQQEFEEDANAVLGASDDQNCTYSKGYIKRQALYACLTCCSEAKFDTLKRAAVCLACSLSCHENHELIELYTKRNFRCDCGNPKFNLNKCQFTQDKIDLNEDNKYNQNFGGLYCICNRPYPDPEFADDDDMIQCIICEDWLHSKHLEASVPTNAQYAEMICKACMQNNDFLHDYTCFAINTIDNEELDVTNTTNANDTQSEVGDSSVCNGNGLQDTLTESTNGVVETRAKEEINKITTKVEGEVENTTAITIRNNPDLITNKPKVHTDNDTILPESSHEESNNLVLDKPEIPNDKTLSQETDSKLLDENIIAPDKSSLSINVEANKEIDMINEGQEKAKLLSEKGGNAIMVNTTYYVNNEQDRIKLSEEEQLEAKLLAEDETEVNVESITDNVSVTLTDQTDGQKNESNMETTADMANNDIRESLSNSIENTINADATEKSDTKSADEDTNDTSVVSSIKNDVECPLEQSHSEFNKIPENTKDESSQVTNENTEPSIITDMKTLPDCSNIDMMDSTNLDTKVVDPKNTINSDNDESMRDISIVQNDSDLIGKNSVSTETIKDKTDHNDCDMMTLVDDSQHVNNIIISSDIKITNKQEQEPEVNGDELLIHQNKRKLSTEEFEIMECTKKAKLAADCVRPLGVKKIFTGATFWPSNFRQKLCTCNNCIDMYKDLAVLYLIDPEDTVSAYEALGVEKVNGAPRSQYEKGLEALSSLDRVQQINALTEYNNMRDKLLDFLKSFKDRKEIVKEEDIKTFFAGMKPRREPDGVYFCR